MDLQAVLICPVLKASALYYRTKLKVHNFTLFDLKSSEGYCFLWDESEGLNADEFCSIMFHFICNKLDLSPPMNEIIIFSDGCTYQNRNSILANNVLSYCSSLRPGNKAGNHVVTDIKCTQYCPSGELKVKTSYQDEYSSIPSRIKVPLVDDLEQIKALYQNKPKITSIKFRHMQEMKHVLPKEVHNIYDSLPHK